MNRETHGKIEKVKGRAKEVAGIVTGNEKLEKEGGRQRAAGAVEETIGTARRRLGKAVARVAAAIEK